MRTVFALAILLTSAARTRADEGWTLITADFQRQSVSLAGLDDNGLHVVRLGAADKSAGDPQGETTVPLDQFLQIERYAPSPGPRGGFTLYLLNGDRLGGEPVSLKDEQLVWRCEALGAVTVSLRQVRAWSEGQKQPDNLDEERKEDRLALRNGDAVRGIVTGLESGRLTVQTGADAAPVALASVRQLFFASTPRPRRAEARAFRVHLADDSIVTAPDARIARGKITLRLPGADPREIDLGAVRSVEQLNGPVSWLSTRSPSKEEQVSMFELKFPARMDQTLSGKPITVGQRTYDHGIAVHANSKLAWALDGTYRALRTQYAIDAGDAGAPNVAANVTVRLLLDDRVVHERKNVVAGQLPPVVTIELGAAKMLTLEVVAGSITDTQDRLNWIEPALLRQKPSSHGGAEAPGSGEEKKKD